VLVVLGALAVNARPKSGPSSTKAPLCHAILGNACNISQSQWVENGVKNYLYPDLRAFLREPYALAERDGSGRAYFWNHFLKSSLLGTHNTIPDRKTAYEANRVLAYGMNGLLLAMDAYVVAGAVAFARRRALRRFEVVLVSLAFCLAFMIGFRALIPAPHHSDFRHVFWALILVSVLYAATVGRLRVVHLGLERVGRWAAIAFLAMSIVYFLPKHELTIRLTRRVVHVDIARYAKVVPPGTPWDRPENLILEANHVAEFALTDAPTVRAIDVSLDNNDKYEIQLVGDETRTLTLGPKPEKKGLARYVERIDPPIAHVRAVRVRPISGDFAYSLGHLVVW
jgi:hypothetical protein